MMPAIDSWTGLLLRGCYSKFQAATWDMYRRQWKGTASAVVNSKTLDILAMLWLTLLNGFVVDHGLGVCCWTAVSADGV